MRYIFGVILGLLLFIKPAIANIDGGKPSQQEEQKPAQQQQQEQQKPVQQGEQLPPCTPFGGDEICAPQHEEIIVEEEEGLPSDVSMWRCIARDRGHEEHWGGHVARGSHYNRVYARALEECRRYHHRCSVQCHRIHH